MTNLPGFGLHQLRLFRPSTIDRVLTKMMRVDPEDREDIQHLLKQTDLRHGSLRAAFDRAAVPPVAEIAEAFARNRTWIENLDSG